MGLFEYLSNKRKNNLQAQTLIKENDIKDNKIIRLAYIYLEVFRGGTALGATTNFSSPFELPKGMSMEEACKVISYLSEEVEKSDEIEEASSTSVAMVSRILENYGFRKIPLQTHGYHHAVYDYDAIRAAMRKDSKNINIDECNEIEGVTDLFTVGGSMKLFQKTNMSHRYFNWFTEGVSRDQVEKVYTKLGIALPERVEIDNVM